LLDDLLVRRAERTLRGFRFCPAFDVLQDVEQDLGIEPSLFVPAFYEPRS
jgi:hypothetical protein